MGQQFTTVLDDVFGAALSQFFGHDGSGYLRARVCHTRRARQHIVWQDACPQTCPPTVVWQSVGTHVVFVKVDDFGDAAHDVANFYRAGFHQKN